MVPKMQVVIVGEIKRNVKKLGFILFLELISME